VRAGSSFRWAGKAGDVRLMCRRWFISCKFLLSLFPPTGAATYGGCRGHVFMYLIYAFCRCRLRDCYHDRGSVDGAGVFRRYDSVWQQGGYDLPDRLSNSWQMQMGWDWVGLKWKRGSIATGPPCMIWLWASIHDQFKYNGMESTAGTEVLVVVSIMISRADGCGTNVTFRGPRHVIKPTLTPDMFVVFLGAKAMIGLCFLRVEIQGRGCSYCTEDDA
jgi:hypothetical protein